MKDQYNGEEIEIQKALAVSNKAAAYLFHIAIWLTERLQTSPEYKIGRDDNRLFTAEQYKAKFSAEMIVEQLEWFNINIENLTSSQIFDNMKCVTEQILEFARTNTDINEVCLYLNSRVVINRAKDAVEDPLSLDWDPVFNDGIE